MVFTIGTLTMEAEGFDVEDPLLPDDEVGK